MGTTESRHFKFDDWLDTYALKPVAAVYMAVVQDHYTASTNAYTQLRQRSKYWQ